MLDFDVSDFCVEVQKTKGFYSGVLRGFSFLPPLSSFVQVCFSDKTGWHGFNVFSLENIVSCVWSFIRAPCTMCHTKHSEDTVGKPFFWTEPGGFIPPYPPEPIRTSPCGPQARSQLWSTISVTCSANDFHNEFVLGEIKNIYCHVMKSVRSPQFST